MRNLMKLIAITAVTALLLFALVFCAVADEKIYTSEIFTLPLERLMRAEEILDAREQAAAQAALEQEAEPEEEGEVPAEGQLSETGEQPEEGETPEEGQLPETGEQPEEGETPEEGQLPETGEQPEEGGTPEEGQVPETGDQPAEGETPEEGQVPETGDQPEEGLNPEETEDPEEDDEDDEDEGFEELGEDAGEVIEEEVKPKRQVIITSNQGDIVTEGDIIVLTSELRGFGDDEIVEYQWQVDRGDGEGWVDVNGADKYKYSFIANRETITYSWRLIVNVVEE